MRTIIITFTHEGMKVAKKAREAMDGEVIIYCHQRCADTYKNEAVPFVAVGSVIKSEFAVSDRILFVCAVAIAVRTIAPYLKARLQTRRCLLQMRAESILYHFYQVILAELMSGAVSLLSG